MIHIQITNDCIKVSGHGDKIMCNTVSVLIQFISSCIPLVDYKSTYGNVTAYFKDSELTDVLINKLIKFIIDLNTTEIFLDLRGGKYATYNRYSGL